MAELSYIFSSQDSENVQPELFSDLPASSPPDQLSSRHSIKPKKPPPITPKRFNRFFTPRSSSNGITKSRSSGKSGRQLRDITKNAINLKHATHGKGATRPVIFADIEQHEQANTTTPKLESRRKRKAVLTPESSPIQSSPCKRARSQSPPNHILELVEEEEDTSDADVSGVTHQETFCLPIRRARSSGINARVLQRSFGGMGAVGRGRVYDHCTDWQIQTADFYSRPEDCHTFSELPFCTARCHTNTLIAVGDDNGGVRLLESAKDSKPAFNTPIVSFRPHVNAVMDLAFSSDDMLLATASGDQTSLLIDMRTQQTRFVMTGHAASVKQVRFQPDNDHVLATASRDGSVHLWDTRCRGAVAVLNTYVSLESSSAGTTESVQRKATYASIYNSIHGAHGARQHPSIQHNSGTAGAGQRDVPSKSEAPGQRGDVSVTALEFLSPGRQHLLLTASDASTCVKLWDIRGRYTRGTPVPISATRLPESHSKHRHFGITSLTLSGDCGRLYALSRDSTVYAYSTNHLALGQAPELSSTTRWQRHGTDGKEGLGPLYGFRHPKFLATSFYVKASVRPAKGDKTEVLAVGSSNHCAVLFPTDEAFLKHNDADMGVTSTPITPSFTNRPGVSRTASGLAARMTDSVPIYTHGTALVRGHDKEVSSVTWTSEGELVTVSDNYLVRCWREGSEARDLRLGGEAEGRRWGCGWAEVEERFDDDEE